MTKTGNLSKRDRDAILRAAQIVDAWAKAQTEQGNTEYGSLAVYNAENAAIELRELLWQTR